MARYDYLIVGAGLFGSVFAHEAREGGRSCLVIDRRDAVGGNIRCREIDSINVHLYGAHIFHTDRQRLWKYVTRFVEMNNYINAPIAFNNGRIFNLPFNMNTFYQLWGVTTPAEAKAEIERQRAPFAHIAKPANLEEQALTLCGRDIYELLIRDYTEKQWGRKCSELPAFIIKRIPLRFTFNNNYFNDTYQGIPIGGYNRLIDALLSDVEVRTGVDFLADRSNLSQLARKIIFTGCIDQFYDYCFGPLAYRSLRFEHQRLDIPDFQGNAVVNYTSSEQPFTRIIEHKHFEFGNQQHTIITREYSETFELGREPYYPVNDNANSAIYAKYQRRAAAEAGVRFGGRLGSYTYADMDDTIAAALALWERERLC